MMRRIVCVGLQAAALLLVSGCRTPGSSTEGVDARIEIPERAEDIRPVLVGQPLPELTLRDPDNTLFDLKAASLEKATILIFFRGGWCPYCNTHLAELQSIEPDLVRLGFQIIAVSPDRPELLKRNGKSKGLKYLLLSDSEMKAAVSLGIAFKVDAATVSKYKTSYGIDIEADSGQKHHLLPVPSVFVIGKDGTIKFSYTNPNYKVRLDSGVLLKAAESVTAGRAPNTP